MPQNKKFSDPFIENGFYHVIAKSNNKENLFRTDENRVYFLKQFNHYLSPFADTYAYCLMNNHVHWLLKIKSDDEIKSHLFQKIEDGLTITEKSFLDVNNHNIHLDELMEKSFNRFFISYSKSFNKFF